MGWGWSRGSGRSWSQVAGGAIGLGRLLVVLTVLGLLLWWVLTR
jgi:hypothetical protein